MIEEIKLPCGEVPIQQTQDGKFLICLSEGVCLEFLGLWEAQDHLRGLELCGLTTKRWIAEPTWWSFWMDLTGFVLGSDQDVEPSLARCLGNIHGDWRTATSLPLFVRSLFGPHLLFLTCLIWGCSGHASAWKGLCLPSRMRVPIGSAFIGSNFIWFCAQRLTVLTRSIR